MNPPDAQHLLETIWSRSAGQYIFLPTMNEQGKWYEGDAISFSGFSNPDSSSYLNQYFTPLKYTVAQRLRRFAAPAGVIFADIDGPKPKFRLAPSILIQSSAHHYHSYWFLDKPAAIVDWEPAAKGWSQEIGADPGGWDTTQVLRIPGTTNLKEGRSRFKVRTILYEPGNVYPLDAFPATSVYDIATGSMPILDKMLATATLNEVLGSDRLLTARYWLTVNDADIRALGTIDRSAIMWQLERSLLETGFSTVEVFNVLYFSAVNKFQERPEMLWREVEKAGSSV